MGLPPKTLSTSQNLFGHYLIFKRGPWKEDPIRSLSDLETMILCVDLYLDYSFHYMISVLVSSLKMKMPLVCSYFRNIP